MRKFILFLIIITCICGIVGAAFTYNKYIESVGENEPSDDDDPTDEPTEDPNTCLHAEEVVLNAIAPTCYKEGRSEGVKCKLCGTILVEQEILEKLAHTPEITPAVEGTCTTPGTSMGSKCSVCHEILMYPEDTGYGDHTPYTVEAIVSTCTENGTTSHIKCSTCYANITEPSTLPLLPHDFSIEIAEVEPSCVSTGFSFHHRCSVCEAVDSDYEIYEKREHEPYMSMSAVAPTCYSLGFTEEISCSWCGEVLQETIEISMIPHSYTENMGEESTCYEQGYTDYCYCEYCGTVFQERLPLPLAPHTPVEILGEASTCTTQGCTSYVYCEVCEVTIVESESLPFAPHNEVATKAIEATCTTYGYSGGKECSVCGTVTKQPTQQAMLPHEYVPMPTIQATCEGQGRTGGTWCSVCETIGTQPTYSPALGHYFGEMFSNRCDRCKGYLSEATNLGFTHTNNVVTSVTSTGTFVGNIMLIPAEKDGRYVTTIKSSAIKSTSVETIVVGSEVTLIEGNAFSGSSKLKTIYIPVNVKHVYGYAFAGCNNLTDIYVQYKEGMLPDTWAENWAAGIPEGCAIHYLAPDSVNYGFKYSLNADGNSYSVTGLDYDNSTDHKLVIPASYNGKTVTAIAANAFKSKYGIIEMQIPSTVTTIGNNAFNFCYDLTKVIFYGEVKLGERAFASCDELSVININKVTEMGAFCFLDTAITIVETNANLTTIPKSCFDGCASLTSVYLTPGLTTILDDAFNSCESLENVYLPDGLEHISYGAFSKCHSLSSVYIPASVTKMGITADGKGKGGVFYNQNGMTIRCGAASQPSGWYEDWNASDYDYDTGEAIAYYPTTWGQAR